MKTRLIVFAKQPIPGQVKTRLQGALTPAQASRLYEAFLRDVLAASTPGPSHDSAIAYWPPSARSWFESARLPGFELLAQRGDGLGERLRNAFLDSFDEGWPAVVVRNSDSPELPHAVVDGACRALRDDDLVIGPDRGGGYYLVGMRPPYREIFTGVPMDSASSLKATLEAGHRAGLTATLLAEHPDIDLPTDVESLTRRLRQHPERAAEIPHTARALRELALL